MTLSSMDLAYFIELYGKDELLRTTQITAPPTLEEFQSRLYIEISSIVQKMEEDRKNRNNDCEDRISLEIVTALSSAGYVAQKDTLNGGHVDLYVGTKKNNFKWIGEAKIWKGVEYINKGLDQLLVRYASGKCNNKALGFVIYFQNKNQVKSLKEWHLHVDKRNDFISKTSLQETCPKIFDSTHRHLIGTEVVVSHFSVNLYWSAQSG